MVSKCNSCKRDKEIVNSHYKLCLQCNELRLKGNKGVKSSEVGKHTKKHISNLKPDKKPVETKHKGSLFVTIKQIKRGWQFFTNNCK